MGSSSSMRSGDNVPIFCKCGVPVAHLTSWTSDNPGRKFVACKFFDRVKKVRYGCNVWEWVDKNQEEWQRVLINELTLEKKILCTNVELLKKEVENVEKERLKLGREKERIMKRMKSKRVFSIESDFFYAILGVLIGMVLGYGMKKFFG